MARATYVGTREDRLFHGAPTFNTDAVTLDPYTKLDLSLLASLLPGVDLTLRADNVFDTKYLNVAGYATPGRVIVAGLRAAF
jgi:outer membrane receptor protein involved in Fe transport